MRTIQYAAIINIVLSLFSSAWASEHLSYGGQSMGSPFKTGTRTSTR